MLREVVDVTALVAAESYSKKAYDESIETLSFQKYAVGQVIQWEGDLESIFEEIAYPNVLVVPAGCLLFPKMLEVVYPLLLKSNGDYNAVKVKCNVEHPEYFIGHTLLSTHSLENEDETRILEVDFKGALCPNV